MATLLHMVSESVGDLGPILAETGERVIEAQSSGDVLQEIIRRRPDVIFLPDEAEPVEGVALLPVVRRMTDQPIVVVGGGDPNQQAQILLQGADAYLTLPLRPVAVKSRLTSLLRPRRPRPESRVDRPVAERPTRPRIRSYDLRLSPTESRLLTALMNRWGVLISADDLASEVWGTPNKLDSLRFYVSQLRLKLVEQSTLRILNQKGLGYRIEIQPQPTVSA